MSEHTPGPWEHVGNGAIVTSVNGYGQEIACVWELGNDDKKHNAALIAAAPDMAAELERVRAKCERLQDELNKTEEALSVSRMEQSELNYAHDEITKLTIDNARLLEALKEIAKGEGAFSLDQLKFAYNTIENMKEIAQTAIESAEGES